MLLKAENKADEQKWRDSIKQVLEYHSKENKLMLKTMNKFMYEHQDTLTER